VLYVDRFGNVQLNLRGEHLREMNIVPGTRVELQLAVERYFAVAARTFADARPGDLILYEDSYGGVSLAINRGDAARLLSVKPGQELRIEVDVP
jgi:S-adenosylmethionine hydrolase